jgi:hypothetical protein
MISCPRVEMQLAEAFGEDNRYFCSLHYCREVTDQDVLLKYFIRFGGALDFARRWQQAMSADNRWFCSEWYRQPITDERILWSYYMVHRDDARRQEPPTGPTGLAC